MAIDWTPIFKKYKGKWVALKDDETTVVGVGKTPKDALDETKKEGYDNPILSNVSKELVTYIGYGV